MAKHTPGPWVVDADDNTLITTPDLHAVGETVAKAALSSDARLIAAAPDLLKALDMMERHFSRYDDTHNNLVLEQARAAIAKATGE